MKMKMKMKFKLYTYDLWADPEGGYSVNDVYPQHEVEINVKPVTYNKGTPHEFVSHYPSDYQLNRNLGARGLTWEGEVEHTLYATDKKGNPACELRRVYS